METKNLTVSDVVKLSSTFKDNLIAIGGEGQAFRVGEHLVLKEFNSENMTNRFPELFDKYCQEIQQFSNCFQTVPKIYSWITYPSKRRNYQIKPTSKFKRYLILQERAAGRELYFKSMYCFYNRNETQIDIKKFNRLREDPLIDLSLYFKIIEEFIEDFIYVNEYIESMPDSALENLVIDVAEMYKCGEYSIPDVYSTNIFFSEDKFTIIDNMIKDGKKSIFEASDADFMEFMITSFLVKFFYLNTRATSLAHGLEGYMSNIYSQGSKIRPLIEKNIDICTENMRRFLKIIKKNFGKLIINNQISYNNIAFYLDKIIGDYQAKSVIKEIEFEK